MYRVEVDFLNDRRPRQISSSAASATLPASFGWALPPALRSPLQERRIQVSLGLVSLGVLGLTGLLGQSTYLEMRRASLERDLGVLQPQARQAVAWQDAALQATQEARALDQVFTRAAEWNSLLSDLARRTPDSVQLTEVREQQGVLTIQGRASRYSSVVDLLQNLRQARYLSPTARLAIDSARKVTAAYRPPGSPPDSPPVQAEFVDFSLSGRLQTPFPAASGT